MENAPSSRLTNDIEPVLVTFPEFKARQLSMAQSIAEVYSRDPKIKGGSLLWELIRFPEMLHPVDDLWPFIVVGKYHPIYRIHPRPSEAGGTMRYFISWEGFEVILAQMTHRVTAGTAFTPWDRQYVDIKPTYTTDDEEKSVQTTKDPGTGKDRVQTPTEKKVMEIFFDEAIVDGVPLLELKENNCKATGLDYTQDGHETEDEESPPIQVGNSHEGSLIEGPAASGVEPNQSIDHGLDNEKLTNGIVDKCLKMKLVQSCRECNSTNIPPRACGDCHSQDLKCEIYKE